MLRRLFNSKSKVTGWLLGALHFAQETGLVNLDPETLRNAGMGLLGLLGVFLRMGMDNSRNGKSSGANRPLNPRVYGVGGAVAVLLCLTLLLAGCSNLRPLLRPTGPDRAMKMVSGDKLNNVALFEGMQTGVCEDFTIRSAGPAAQARLQAEVAKIEKRHSGDAGKLKQIRLELDGIFKADNVTEAEVHASRVVDLLNTLQGTHEAGELDGVKSTLAAMVDSEAVGGCFLPVLVSGEKKPRTVVCTVGEVYRKCKDFKPHETRVAFEGVDLRDGGGRYLPNGANGLKGRPVS